MVSASASEFIKHNSPAVSETAGLLCLRRFYVAIIAPREEPVASDDRWLAIGSSRGA